MPKNKIILSAKVSAVQDLIAVYRRWPALRLCDPSRPDRSRHGLEGHRRLLGRARHPAAAGHRRHHPHFADAEPGGDRTLEVQVAQELLQTMGFRTFVPLVAACPGCGRTTSTTFQELARSIQDFIRDSMPGWKTQYPGVEKPQRRGDGLHRQRPRRIQACRYRHLAARHRRGPAAPVFVDGKKAAPCAAQASRPTSRRW
jgi:(E)-4-hydroxy-3-methylbut-2-enyl-diphosphate synthase